MKVKLTQPVADEPTVNGHIYPREVLEKAVVEFNEKRSGVIGGPFSPDGKPVVLERASHITKSLELGEDGRLIADIEILNSPNGRRMAELVAKSQKGIQVLRLGTIGRGEVKEGTLGPSYELRNVAWDAGDQAEPA